MKPTTLKWSAVAALAAVAVYLGTLVGTAQPEVKPDPNTQKLEQTLSKLDALSTKLDELSQKLDAMQKDVQFIKNRGKG